ncbi:hypothetical protein ONZ45_g17330 [Pleurotus djamor]|nr:hypothetical protein ONZ45_g17330 [Pleurotus djamor]
MPFDVEIAVPTLDKLGATVPTDLDATKVAHQWFDNFSTLLQNNDGERAADLFAEDSVWRDILALTWDFRTFIGKPKIKQFLQDQLAVMKPRNAKLSDAGLALYKPFPDVAWIQGSFTFETEVGIASGILRLVPTANGDWKAHALFTNLEELKGHPEKIGSLRDAEPNHGKWEDARRRAIAHEDSEPTVLIVGGGQSGLEVAARLKCLGVDSLVIEKNERLGDNWRKRYDALCLHDPVWYDHMPYLPFPSTWPVYTPARKMANWLESYAEHLELNVWTATSVQRVAQDASRIWVVTVKKSDGTERVFKPKHVVYATGLGDTAANVPTYPGMDDFQGQVLHSTQHQRASDHAGKKVVVVGACTSAHDICTDYYLNGVDVTMFQRSSTYVVSNKNLFKYMLSGLYSENSPPVDVADRLTAEADKATLDGLNKVGFKTNLGLRDAGLFLLAWDRAGGYYIDVGASQLIIDGKIKLKSGTQIESFTKTGLKFTDGSELPADVVLFATGFASAGKAMEVITDKEISSRVGQIWSLNEEGEIYGSWRDLGVPNMWFMNGNLALCRFHSKHLALHSKYVHNKDAILGGGNPEFLKTWAAFEANEFNIKNENGVGWDDTVKFTRTWRQGQVASACDVLVDQ